MRMYKMKYISILFILVFVLTSCFGSLCSDKIVKKLNSPDGKHVATAFIRDCGATTDFSPQVSLLRKVDTRMNSPKNIFIGNHSQFIDIYWESDSVLVIVYNCSEEDIFKKSKNEFGIKIKYIVATRR